MQPPARLRFAAALLFFPLGALLLAFVWQTRHPEGLWRPDPPPAEAPEP
jgi:hypothetical protein